MCGVIGYCGSTDALPRLLDGLEQLEYRGYDSAGVCLVGDGRLDIVRSVGSIHRLREKLNGNGRVGATTGIGHTRWATHGRVTEANAHPLTDGRRAEVAIVLNGIVENHAALREELAREGEEFSSETDAEAVAHLIRRAYRGSLPEAVASAEARLEGDFAFIAAHREHPHLLVGVRRRCPLLVGLGEGQNFLASSITAFAGETHRVKLVGDDEIVSVTPAEVRVTDARGVELDQPETLVPWDEAAAERHGYETFMLKEIHEQPAAVAATIARNLRLGVLGDSWMLDLGLVGGMDLGRFERIVMVACGTAYHAGLVGRYAIEEWAGVPCESDLASEWRYRKPRVDERTLVIGISQSGETADTLGAIRLASAAGARTLAVTNSPGSQITREVDAVLYTHAGIEIGVAATKTFTTQVALLYLLAIRVAQLRGTLRNGDVALLIDELRALPQKLVTTLEGEASVSAIAERQRAKGFFLYLGRHIGLPVCLEGALKLKEIAYLPTDAYAAGEMKHGPIALLAEGTPVVCVATRSQVSDKLASNLEEVRARGAHVIAVATSGDEEIHAVADDVIAVPRSHPLLQPVLAVVPLQLLAYRLARCHGLDIDKPRNLAKTVTVE